jgi:hypothetical protein
VNVTPAVWEGWNKYIDTVDFKRYEYMLTLGANTKVLIGVHLTQTGSVDWHVLINAFNPSAGEHIEFEGSFPSLMEAKAVAWAQAQKALEVRNKNS